MSYEKALEMAAPMFQYELGKFQYLLESKELTAHDKEVYRGLLEYHVDEGRMCYSFKALSALLYKHHGSKAVILMNMTCHWRKRMSRGIMKKWSHLSETCLNRR